MKRFINITSPSIYFDYKHQLNLKESDRPKEFSNAYAETKFLAEQLVTAANSDKFWTMSIRPRGVIGAGDRNWLPRIIKMRHSDSLIQAGDGKNLADFTTVKNLLHVVDLAVAAPRDAFGKVFNITNGAPESLWQMIDNSLAAVGLDGKRKIIPLPVAMLLARGSEMYHQLRGSEAEPSLLPIKVGVAAYSMTLDISAAKRHLGYAPKYTTADGIQEFAKWWANQQK